MHVAPTWLGLRPIPGEQYRVNITAGPSDQGNQIYDTIVIPAGEWEFYELQVNGDDVYVREDGDATNMNTGFQILDGSRTIVHKELIRNMRIATQNSGTCYVTVQPCERIANLAL